MEITDIIEDRSTNNWFRQPPIQRQKWGDTQVLPHTNWGDLFFDLFYVAAAYNLAYIIKSDPSAWSFLYVIGCFGPMKGLWTNKTLYDARFQIPDDVLHLLLEVLQLCIVATAVLHIRPVKYMSAVSSSPEMFLFCAAIWFGHIYHICTYLEIRFWGVNGQSSAKYASMTSILSMIPSFILVTAATIYSAVIFYSAEDGASDYSDNYRLLAGGDDTYSKSEVTHHVPIILLLSSWIISQVIFYPISYIRGKGANFKKYAVPINVDFVIHRNGEWTMLMLGESILSLLIVEVSDEIPAFYITFYTGILSVTLLQYLYFKSQPHHADGHAMRRTRSAGYAFASLINTYSTALVIVGVSFKMLLEEYAYEEPTIEKAVRRTPYLSRLLASGGGESKYSLEDRRKRISIFFCIGLAMVFICLDLMSLTHRGIKGSMERCHCADNKLRVKGILLVVVLRLVGILYIGTACLYLTEPESVALAGFASIILQVLIRWMGTKYFPSSEKDEHHSHGGKNKPQPNILDAEVNEDQWPNTTQPLSIQNDSA